MQTVVQVFCTPGRSLRDAISGDRRLQGHDLGVVAARKPGRNPGWLKLRSLHPERPGAVNVEWNRDLRLLTCRIVTKLRNRPNMIASDLVGYLLSRHWRRIESITIAPRWNH
jgi:hypothetical protein